MLAVLLKTMQRLEMEATQECTSVISRMEAGFLISAMDNLKPTTCTQPPFEWNAYMHYMCFRSEIVEPLHIC